MSFTSPHASIMHWTGVTKPMELLPMTRCRMGISFGHRSHPAKSCRPCSLRQVLRGCLPSACACTSEKSAGGRRSVRQSDAVLVQLAIQRVAADSQRAGGTADVPVHLFKFAQQSFTFCGTQRRCVVAGRDRGDRLGGAVAGDFLWQVAWSYHVVGAKCSGCAQGIA